MCLLSFTGSIPGPIFTGAMIDASCSLWEDDCGVRGSCWVYNNHNMSLRLFILTIVLKILSIGFNILAIFVYKPPPEAKSTEALPIQDDIHELNENNSNNIPDSSSTEKIVSSRL